MKNPNVDAEFVLEHQGYVNRLARSLVFDEAGAEDLAQQVWLSAIENPPTHARGLRGWLATIARHLASSARRGRSRSDERERAAARDEAVAAADELVAREALRAKLVKSVLALDEPFRETIILRYFDELSPRAIAAKQGVPVATVKSRLKRGLASLRERLDREGGGRGAWSLALVNGLHLAPTTAGLATFGVQSLAHGVLLMTATKKVLLAAAIFVACFATWRLTHPLAQPNTLKLAELDAAPASAVEAPAAVSDPRAQAADRRSVPHTIRGKRAVPPIAVGTGPGDLDVRVELREGHVPMADVSVSVNPMTAGMLTFGATATTQRTRTLRTDATGVAHFVGLDPGEVTLDLDRGYHGFGAVRSGVVSSATVFVEDFFEVAGRVTDEQGVPVEAAEVWLATNSEASCCYQVATARADGRFEIHAVKPSHVSVFARKSGRGPSARKFLRGNVGATVEVALSLRGSGAALEGIVRDERGEPIADALVNVGSRSNPEASASLTYRPSILDGMLARSDSNGHFTLDGLLPGPTWIDCSASGLQASREAIELVAGATGHHDVRLVRGASLRGTVQHADGTPAKEARVTLRTPNSWQTRAETTADDGSYRFDGLEPGEVHLMADDRQLQRLEADLPLIDGEEAIWNPRLEAGLDLVVRVLDESGEPTKKVKVHVAREVAGKEPFLRGAEWEKAGVFRAKGCPDAACVVTVYPKDSQLFALTEVRDVRPGGPEIVVRLDPARRPTIYLKGRVVDPDGKPLAACNLTTLNSDLQWAIGEIAKEDGTFRCGPFPPGPWGITVEHEGFAKFYAPERPLAAGATLDFGTIRLQRGDALEIAIVYPPEAQHYPPWITVHGLDSGIEAWCKVEGDHARTPPLSPGRYELRVEGAYAACTLATEFVAGAANKVLLELKPGVAFAIQLDGATPGVNTELELLDSAGKLLMERSPPLKKVDAFKFPACLAPGRYRIEVSDSGGRKASLDFDVDASIAQKTIEVRLP